MYAVIKTGGKQYRVAEGDLVRVEKIEGEVGKIVELDEIVLLVNGDQVEIGRPHIIDAGLGIDLVEIVEHGKDKKIVVFKSKRRKGYRKKQGHRQQHTVLKIKEIKS